MKITKFKIIYVVLLHYQITYVTFIIMMIIIIIIIKFTKRPRQLSFQHRSNIMENFSSNKLNSNNKLMDCCFLLLSII